MELFFNDSPQNKTETNKKKHALYYIMLIHRLQHKKMLKYKIMFTYLNNK